MNSHSIDFYIQKYQKKKYLDKLKALEECKNYINKMVSVKIDRPLGSRPIKEHPNFMYELNYGFIPNTISGDGEELDCYVLGIETPIKEYTGKCIAIVHRLYEIDDKLIIVPETQNYSIKEIEQAVFFSEKYHNNDYSFYIL